MEFGVLVELVYWWIWCISVLVTWGMSNTLDGLEGRRIHTVSHFTVLYIFPQCGCAVLCTLFRPGVYYPLVRVIILA